ncbi:MAG: hypothetical protein ACO25B_13570, partial [Chitinophagaceae bacterium]
MKPYNYLVQFGVCILLLFTGCKKENDNNLSARTKLLTEKEWKIARFEEKINPGDPWDDITAGIDACDIDNLIRFTENGNYTEKEGPSRCNPADPDIVNSGNWQFMNNESSIQITESNSRTVDLLIEQLDSGTFRYTISDPGFGIYLRIT